MDAAGIITLTCPRCATPIRARTADAGQRVCCPHPDCQRTVPVPFALDEDEPDEPVLLPEDPADPESVPVAVARPPAATILVPAPRPRRKRPRYEEGGEPAPRAPVLPWALTGLALLVASVATAGLVAVVVQDRSTSDTVAALEAKSRDLRAENRKLREQLDAAAPKGTGTAPPASRPADEPPPPARPDPAAPPNGPKLPKAEPPARPQGREAFVGSWTITGPDVEKNGTELSIEFRADGTCALHVRAGGIDQELSGVWRWAAPRLHVDLNGTAGVPAEVKWNGPDEFIGTGSNRPLTFRRKDGR